VLGRARARGLLEISLHQVREYARGPHLQVDDTPYGGGQGMVMKPEPLVAAIEHAAAVDAPRRILLSATGVPFSQAHARALSAEPALLLVCGRYEGVDERVKTYVDEELSIGDYVLTGGEVAALVLLDAVGRLLPGVLGNDASAGDDSFTTGLLEYPQYTRPATFREARVPDVLLSGDHAAIARWRRQASLRTTWSRRPDLLARAPLDDEDRAFLRSLGWRDG
jgi:tRNA (guanine37-N1)-methyltransferase